MININVYASNIDSSCIVNYDNELVVTIKFNTDSDKINNYSFIYNSEELNISLPIPNKVGYKFEGWYRDRNYTMKINDTLNKEELKKLNIIPSKLGCNISNAETTLYAKYVRDESCNNISSNIDIIFDTDGGNKIKALRVDNNSDEVVLPIPSKDEYIFWGWYLDSELLHKIDNNVSYEFLNNNLLLSVNKNDNCSEYKEGYLYAKWVKKDLLAYYIIDAADRNLYAINKNV